MLTLANGTGYLPGVLELSNFISQFGFPLLYIFWREIFLCYDEEMDFGCPESKGEEKPSVSNVMKGFNVSVLSCNAKIPSSECRDIVCIRLHVYQESSAKAERLVEDLHQRSRTLLCCLVAMLEMNCTYPEVDIPQIPLHASNSTPSVPTRSPMVW